MKILIADKLAPSARTALEPLGADVAYEPTLNGDALTEAVEDADILIVRSTKVPAATLAAARSLALVVRAGSGVNNIDVDEASTRGIFVANCPGKNSIAVAELTMGLMVSLDRRIPENVQDFREGRWNKATYSKARGLAGRTVGLIGFGGIGRAVATRAGAFGMDVIAWSRSLTDERAAEVGATRANSILDLAERADIVSLHVPATANTRHLVDEAVLRAMRPGAMLINTSRSSVVDEDALLRLIDDNELRYAADVFEGEPAAKTGHVTSPLQAHPRVVVTHHIGASTEQAQEAVAAEASRVVRTFVETGHVENGVNLCARSPATHQLTVRHSDRVGVLADVLGLIRRHGLNVEEMENVIFDGARAACCFIRLAAKPPATLMDAIDGHEHVLGAGAFELS